MRFVTLYIARKIAQLFFFTEKFAFLFKKFCFLQPFRCYRNYPINSTVIVKKLLGPVQVVPSGLSHSVKREKIGEILVFHQKKFAFFSKIYAFKQPRRCYRNDL